MVRHDVPRSTRRMNDRRRTVQSRKPDANRRSAVQSPTRTMACPECGARCAAFKPVGISLRCPKCGVIVRAASSQRDRAMGLIDEFDAEWTVRTGAILKALDALLDTAQNAPPHGASDETLSPGRFNRLRAV